MMKGVNISEKTINNLSILLKGQQALLRKFILESEMESSIKEVKEEEKDSVPSTV